MVIYVKKLYRKQVSISNSLLILGVPATYVNETSTTETGNGTGTTKDPTEAAEGKINYDYNFN